MILLLSSKRDLFCAWRGFDCGFFVLRYVDDDLYWIGSCDVEECYAVKCDFLRTFQNLISMEDIRIFATVILTCTGINLSQRVCIFMPCICFPSACDGVSVLKHLGASFEIRCWRLSEMRIRCHIDLHWSMVCIAPFGKSFSTSLTFKHLVEIVEWKFFHLAFGYFQMASIISVNPEIHLAVSPDLSIHVVKDRYSRILQIFVQKICTLVQTQYP
jgi:hypothetical protein